MRASICGVVVAAGLAALCAAGTAALAAGPVTHVAGAPAKNLPPKKPTVRGPRTTHDRTPTYKFFSKDPDGKVEALRIWCGFDIVRLHRCGWQWTPKRLRPGKHVLRVRIVDGRGARSALAVVRVSILR